jgi:hypothetical protein
MAPFAVDRDSKGESTLMYRFDVLSAVNDALLGAKKGATKSVERRQVDISRGRRVIGSIPTPASITSILRIRFPPIERRRERRRIVVEERRHTDVRRARQAARRPAQ